MVNKPLIRPYFWGGGGTLGGDRLTSHEMRFVLESTIFRGELLVSERVPSGELTWQLKSTIFERYVRYINLPFSVGLWFNRFIEKY